MANQITFTSVNPGLYGDLISINLVGVTDATTVVVSVATSNYNQATITVTVGYNLGTRALNVADWNAVAALFNSSGGSAFASAVGSASTQFDGSYGTKSLINGTNGNAPGQFFFSLAAAPPVATPVPAGSGPARGNPKITINENDLCLGLEFSQFNLIDPQAFSCARKPLCFCVDERDWSGIEDAEELIQSGPPAGAIDFNPANGIPLPAPADGDVLVLQFEVPIGYDGIILGQYNDYIPSPLQIPSPFVQGSGDIVWRISANSRYLRDCGAIDVSLGSPRALAPVAGGIQLRSGNLVQLWVTAPNGSGQLSPGLGSIVMGCHGYFWPRR